MNKGYFIVVEGCDYAGKSTLVDKLRKKLVSEGHDVVVTRQPGGTEMAEELRGIVKKDRDYDVSPTTEYLIMMAARSDLVETVIKPALAAGKVVLSDRHDGSTAAYQGMVIPAVSEVASIDPDLTIYLDKKPVDFEASVAERGEECRIEQRGIEFQKEVYNNYADYFSIRGDEMVTIDVNEGYNDPSYEAGLVETLRRVAETPKYLRSLYGRDGAKEFVDALFDAINVGVILIGTPVGLIPHYSKIELAENATDEQIDDYVSYHLGTGHKWQRGQRPVTPLRMAATRATQLGIKDTSEA